MTSGSGDVFVLSANPPQHAVILLSGEMAEPHEIGGLQEKADTKQRQLYTSRPESMSSSI